MEIRQIEYFVISVEEKSFNKASEKLFTSQPAISKSIALLEKELGYKLLDRTSKGLKLTSHGQKFYHYAKNVMKQVGIMKNIDFYDEENLFTIASYPSRFISHAITNYYNKNNGDINIQYQEGSVQDIINLISLGTCEIGIIYISPKQKQAFEHIISHKHLEFIPITQTELCIYVGEKNELYNKQKSIGIEELSKLSYVRGLKDFFSVEHHFDLVSLNEINTSYFKEIILTNSDHLVLETLKNTDLCYLGINLHDETVGSKIEINSEEKYLTLGYIKNKSSELSELSRDFLSDFNKIIEK